VLALVATAVAATYVVQLTDPDPWWHLATGRWIVEHHAIPRVDPFSFTVAGASWHAVDWLADLTMYGAWALAGAGGLAALTALAAFVMLWFVGLTLRELDASTPTMAAVVACTGILVQGRYSMARPMTLGAAALCATIYLCTRSWQRVDRSRLDRSVLVAAPLVLVWSALHPSAILGIVVLAVFAIAAVATRHGAARLYIGATLLALALAALVPSARALFDVAAAHDRATLALALTTEWARPRLGDRELWLPALGTLAAVATMLASPDRRRALPFVGIAAVGAILASRYTRNLYEAILLAAPVAGLAVERAARRLAAAKLRAAPLLVAVAVGVVVPALHVRLAPAEFSTRFGVGPAPDAVPRQTLDLLRTLPAGHVMNDCTLGGWLIWQRIPVYCDGRAVALYTQADVERLFLPLYADAATIDAVADRFDIHYALARFDSTFQDTLMTAPSWVPLATDREHALFVRRRYLAELPRDVLPLEQFRFTSDARWLDTWYAAVAADPARAARLEAEVVRAVATCDESRTLHAALHYLAGAQPALADRLKRALATSYGR
jgi:hypothetical protein